MQSDGQGGWGRSAFGDRTDHLYHRRWSWNQRATGAARSG